MDLPFLTANNQTLRGSNFIASRPALAIPYLTIVSVSMVIGTLGDILIICAVFSQKELHSVGNLLIVNLSFADLCVTTFVDPFSIVGMVQGSAWFETWSGMCVLIACICLTSCFCSLLTIGAIAINRYILICHYPLYNKVYTQRNTILMCVGLWVFSFLAEMPNFLGWGDHVYDKKNLMCVWDRTADFSYSIFFSVVGVAIPVILISICYALVYQHLLSAKPTLTLLQAGSQMTTTRDLNIMKQTRQLTRMVFVSFVVFAVCWLPYAFVVALDYNDVYPLELHLYVILIAHFNSSVNNIVYGICNKSFRHAYFRLLGLHCCNPSVESKDLDAETTELTATSADPTVSRDVATTKCTRFRIFFMSKIN